MDLDIGKAIRQAAKITLRGGVIGKVSSVVLVGSICIAALGIASGNPWIMGGGIAAILLFGFPLMWRTLSFAERNPQAALLEGAEFLIHQQMVLGTKTNPVLVVAPETFAEERAQGELPEPAEEGLIISDDVEEADQLPVPPPRGGREDA